MSISFRSLVTPTSVAGIGPAAVRKLAASLVKRSSAPPKSKDDEAATLATWLRGFDPQDEPAFFEALQNVAHVLGQEDIQQTLTDRGIKIPVGAHLGEVLVDIALKTPDLLLELSAQVSVSEAHSAKAFATYRRGGPKKKLRGFPPREIKKIEAAFQASLDQAGHGRFCRVFPSAHGNRFAFVISYGAGLRSSRIISKEDSPTLQTARAPRDAVVFVSPDSRELRISASSRRERQICVSVIGAAVDPEAKFLVADLFALDRICTKAFARSIRRFSGPDFTAARLVELELIHRNDAGTRIILRGSDVLQVADDEGIELKHYEPKKATLEFTPSERQGRSKWRIHLLSRDRHRCTVRTWDDDTVFGLLGDLGLMLGPD